MLVNTNVRSRSRTSLFTATLIALLILLTGICRAQSSDPQKRGFTPGGSYALSDFETINTTNGNMILNFPLGKLPAGRGGLSAAFSLLYNSKLWETHVEYVPDLSNQICAQNFLNDSEDGGWRYGVAYSVRLFNRLDDYDEFPQCPSLQAFFIWKLRMTFPDGSNHEFRPAGFNDNLSDGYFTIRPDGYDTGCQGTAQSVTTGMTYYSTDGTYARLFFPFRQDGNFSANWTLSMPDGSRVVSDQGVQRIYDRNDNFIEVGNFLGSGPPGTVLSDQLGRYVVIGHDSVNEEDLVQVAGVNNETLTWRVKWKSIQVNKSYKTTAWGVTNTRGGTSTQFTEIPFRVVDRITCPVQAGSLTYIFGYNADNTANPSVGWGEVSSISLPSGAQAIYEWERDNSGSGPPFGLPNVDRVKENSPVRKTLNYQQEHDGTLTPVSEEWQYSISRTGSAVTAPDGGTTSQMHGDTSFPNAASGLARRTVQPDGTTIDRIWQQNLPIGLNPMVQNNPYVKTEFTSITDAAGNLAQTSIKDYNYDKNGNVTQIREYDWVPYSSIHSGGNLIIPPGAPLKRVTTNSYFNSTPDATSSSANGNCYWNSSAPILRNALASSQIGDGSQILSRTELFYDNPSTTGNVIQQKSWDSALGPYSNPLTAGNSLSVSNQYNQYGSPILATDARGHQTQYIYGLVGAVTDLYPTRILTAYQTSVQRVESRQYDFYTGVVTRVTDEDNNVSTSTAYDAFGRPTLVRAAEGKPEEVTTSTEYSDVGRRVIARSDLNTVGDGRVATIQHYDQLGRIRLTRQLEDATAQSPVDETAGIKVQTRYMFSGSASFVLKSNPYRAQTSAASAVEATMGWSRQKTDNTGRPVEVQTFGGAGLPAPWGPNTASTGTTTMSYDAQYTTVADQSGALRRNKADGLGRLIRVDEPDAGSSLGLPDSPVQPTTYEYNALGNLTRVIQQSQIRTFNYTSLSRLKESINPEGGAISFAYDENGNLKTRIDPRLLPGTQTNVTTSYAYDQLNRVTSRTYNDGTPNVVFIYDSPGVLNSKGRLCSVSSSVSTYSYGEYDSVGMVRTGTQTTDGQSYSIGYQYNLARSLISQTYPSGRVVKTDYDGAGRVAGVKNNATGSYYVGAAPAEANRIQYSAFGAVQAARLGNGLWEHTNFNSRLQAVQIGLGSASTNSSYLQLDFGYGTTNNNGNKLSQTITVPTVGGVAGFAATQTYTYDSLNRLATAKENNGSSWTQNFTYDRYGNRNFTSGTTFPAALTPANNPAINSANNRIDNLVAGQTNVLYDEAGNLAREVGGHIYEYDAENMLRGYDGGAGAAGGATYRYDGDGRRIKKVVGGSPLVTTVFVYDITGRLVAEYSDAGPTGSGTSYLTSDTLGSPRVITGANQELLSRHDYLPFGEEVTPAYGGRTEAQGYLADNVRQKFTQKERDNETGLDFFEARYYASIQGRFTSVDPLMASGSLGSPQSWNRYSYCFNNPLRFTDPSGMLAGDFYNEEGKRLGTDGKNDGKVYVVTNDEQAKQIKAVDKKGGTTDLSAVSSAIELPDLDVRTAIGAAVDRSNSPTTDDTRGGFHEEGLQWGTDASGQSQIVNAAPGAYSNPQVNTEASITVTTAANPAQQGILTNVAGSAHVHPKGEIKIEEGPKAQPGQVIIGGTIKTTTSSFNQFPSPRDISNARPGTNVVVGARDKKVYLYDSGGTRATFPLNKFRSIGRK